MKAIRKSDGKEIKFIEKHITMFKNTTTVSFIDSEGKEYEQSELASIFPDLDFNLPKEKESAVIEGWVARTQGGKLGICRVKPERRCGDWWLDVSPVDNAIYALPSDLFPSLTWESEPKKCKITITPIE